MLKNKIAVCPGTFDPITLGHLDVIERGLKLFDKIVVGIAEAEEKECLFSWQERIDLAKKSLAKLENVEVKGFNGLLVDFARESKAQAILRGLRAVSDFEFEFQNASMNRKLAPDIESVFIMTSEKFFYLSSSMVKEVARLKGEISCLVPKEVELGLKEKFK